MRTAKFTSLRGNTAVESMVANCKKAPVCPHNYNGEKSVCANCAVPLCTTANCKSTSAPE
ncbi:hypothetical protein DPMN_157924 [Dreissena polymorpha]|uniref:Uncharacterized protein n=1 Tax=Dreissena polymorpha TaxID=45954 RepID=A0A9D4EGC9_DREPO|nr:hypothetical protein DPMN_157924 [Dreissena polymorpha]